MTHYCLPPPKKEVAAFYLKLDKLTPRTEERKLVSGDQPFKPGRIKMFMKTWEPRISKGAIYHHAGLCLVGTLECPCCKAEAEVTTIIHVVIGQHYTSLQHDVEREVEELAAERACTECGTVSIMPPRDVTRLKDEAIARITETWIREQATLIGAKIGADTCIYNKARRVA